MNSCAHVLILHTYNYIQLHIITYNYIKLHNYLLLLLSDVAGVSGEVNRLVGAAVPAEGEEVGREIDISSVDHALAVDGQVIM